MIINILNGKFLLGNFIFGYLWLPLNAETTVIALMLQKYADR